MLSFRTGSLILGTSALLMLGGCGSNSSVDTPPVASSSSSSSSSSSVASSLSSSSQSSSSAPSLTLCGFEDTLVAISSTQHTRLEAENFDPCDGSFADSTNTNSGGAYRDLAVDINAHTPAGDGFYITDMVAGEYLEYSLTVERSGFYSLNYRVQPGSSAATYQLTQAGQLLKGSQITVNTSDSGWQDVSSQPVYLSDGPQILRLEVVAGGADLDYLEFAYSEALTIAPEDAVAAMGIGINLGNTLDAFPNEGDWALPAERHHLEDFAEAGFKHVRIPATWNDHTAQSAPYTISQARMDRAEEIVDWALAEGFYVILNAHHEHWLSEGYNSSKQARFNAMWTQIAARFQHKSARLMLEIFNEPVGMTAAQVNNLNAEILPIIRATNPERLVVIAGHDYTGINTLASLALPEDDYLIGNFHSYDPWPFAGQCTRSWGSPQDYTELAAIYQIASDWVASTGVPLMLNEFGAAKFDFTAPGNICATADRLAYLEHHVTLATEKGIGATFWDDGGSFSTYDRESRTWGPEKDVLVAPNL